ncbi:glycosyltransferase family 4 protein [Pelagibacterium halotolerans]|nr:glycosyltransferase family 4 protein [Pelagibacterium halotolerans]QJR17217.1 glycosyltransferase family 4 protein [Pelagibacterium halotolerans]SEA88838.1 Glycosyltransferase involved in cell wall bisynthesis [Pelagibacterium halotolerans]
MLSYANALMDLGYDVLIVQLVDEWEPYKDELHPEIRMASLFRSRTLRRFGASNWLRRRDYYLLSFLGVRRLRRLMDREKPWRMITALLAVPLILACPPKARGQIVVSVQGFPKFLAKSGGGAYYKVEDSIRLWMWRRFYGACGHVITMTEYTRQKLISMGVVPSHKVRCISNPLFQTQPAKLPQTSVFSNVIYVGRVTEQKDPGLFADAAREAHKLGLPLNFHVFGEGTNADIAKLRERAAPGFLTFHGHVEPLWERIPENAILLCTSRWEDPGHMIVEAMWHGVPVVAVERQSGHLELLDEGRGLTCSPTPEAILQTLTRFQHRSDINNILAAAQSYVSRRFTSDSFRYAVKELLNDKSSF